MCKIWIIFLIARKMCIYFSITNWLAPLSPNSRAFCDSLFMQKGEASGRMWLAQLSSGKAQFNCLLSCVPLDAAVAS